MRVQVVAPHAPHPGVLHAGGAYLLGHLGIVAEQHDVHLLAPDRPGTREEAALAPPWLTVTLAPGVDAGPGGPQWHADRVLRRLRGPAPPPQTLRGLRAAGLVNRARDADLVELHWPEYAYLALLLRRARVRTPLVVFAHDVDSQAGASRVRAYGDGVDRAAELILRRHNLRQERRALEAADLVVAFKASDGDLLRRLGVRTPVHVTEPWLAAPSGATAERVPSSLLFTGAMWRRENEDGVRWFLEHVWPQVRHALPDATFTVAGAGPTERLRQAAAQAGGVTVTGEVEDLEPYYLQASLFVAPLFVGGGLKFKVPQAMLYDLPVVATTVAAEGVVEEAPPGAFLFVGDDSAAMGAAVVKALTDPVRAAVVGAAAGSWSAQHYSFRRSAEALMRKYGALVGARLVM